MRPNMLQRGAVIIEDAEEREATQGWDHPSQAHQLVVQVQG